MTTAAVGLFESLPEDRRGWVMPWRFGGLKSAGDRNHAQSADDEASSLRHELGHVFLLRTFLPNHRKPQYGGDAPDWLDEAAAIALESPASRADRRTRFVALVKAGRLKPFTDFVSQAHPIFANQRLQNEIARARAASPNQPVVLEFALGELGLTSTFADDFYAQTGAVIDFLDAIGPVDTLGLIARDIAETSEAAGWLIRLGPRLGIATSESWNRRFAEWARMARDTSSARDCQEVAP